MITAKEIYNLMKVNPDGFTHWIGHWIEPGPTAPCFLGKYPDTMSLRLSLEQTEEDAIAWIEAWLHRNRWVAVDSIGGWNDGRGCYVLDFGQALYGASHLLRWANDCGSSDEKEIAVFYRDRWICNLDITPLITAFHKEDGEVRRRMGAWL